MIKINIFLKYFYILLGFVMVSYIIYVRIFLVRVPKDLRINFWSDNYNVKLLFLFLSIIICFIIIIKNVLIELGIKSKENKLSVILENISNIIDISLKHFCSFLACFFHNPEDILSYISDRFYYYWHKYPEYYLLFITYIIRSFIVLIFLIEVFFKFKLDLFYKSLSLLCIILVIKIFIFVLKDFAQNLEALREALIIKDCGIDEETVLPITNYSLKPGFEDNDLHYLIKEFIICNKLSGYLSLYDRYKTFFQPKFNIIIYSLYLIGWSFILFTNIF